MDEKNIISYKPDLNIYGKASSFVKGNGAVSSAPVNIKTETNINTNKSKNLINFIYYSPKEAVNAINDLENFLNLKITDIIENHSDNIYKAEYFTENDVNKRELILEKNSNDLQYGSTELEMLSYIQKINADLYDILQLYMTCVFGEKADVSEVNDIIQSYISQIEGYEQQEQYTKVNYIDLYYETKVSYILSDFIGQLDSICSDFLNIKDKSSLTLDTNSDSYKLLIEYFNKQNTELESNIFNVKNCSNNIYNALRNIYIKKQQLNKNLDLFSDAYNMEDSKELIYDIEGKCYDELDKCVSTLIKACMNYNMCYGDILETIKNKSKYRKIV